MAAELTTFRERIAAAMLRAGYRHNELADIADFDAGQLSTLKSGKTLPHVVSIERFTRLSKALGVRLAWLYEGTGERDRPESEWPAGLRERRALSSKERFSRVSPGLGVSKEIVDRVLAKYASEAYDRDPPYSAEFFDARAREMMKRARRVREGIAATKYALDYNKPKLDETPSKRAPRSKRGKIAAGDK